MSREPLGDRITMFDPVLMPASFRHMHEIYESRLVSGGDHVRELARTPGRLRAPALPEHAMGIVVLQGDALVHERYALGTSAEDLLPSFSLAKSVVSTLLATLVRDGLVTLDDDLGARVAALRGSAFDGVEVRHALRMTSGVGFVEDYEDDAGDARPFWFGSLALHEHDQLSYLRRLEREHAPGAVFNYSGADTFALGLLVREVCGTTLSAALSDRLWRPFGMEADARWLIDAPGGAGVEPGYAGLCARLRDYARLGRLMLDDRGLLPAGWVEQATDGPVTESGAGYGYQWWRPDPAERAFTGRGVFGQYLWVDPDVDAVVALAGAWPTPGDDELADESVALIRSIVGELRRGREIETQTTS